MLEIEKIQKLIEIAKTETEKEEIRNAEEGLANAVHKMFGSTQEYLTEGKKPEKEPVGLSKALTVLKHYGDIYGVEFPEFETKQDAVMYVITYAGQIIFGRE